MNILPSAWIKALFVLPLCLAACTPVADSNTASISGDVYFDCDKDGKCGEDETGIADMYVRLYYGACGKNMIQTHKTEFCGCCSKWTEHLEHSGLSVNVIVVEDTSLVRTRLGVPRELASCHTAVVGDYWVEGHVPVDLVSRL